jgi:hypothetical protein
VRLATTFLRNEPNSEGGFNVTHVELIDENGGGPGVRLRKPAKPKR